MSMKTAWPYPCDVHLGVVVRSDGDLSARLHRYTLDKNMVEMEKLLNKGVEVDSDSINHLGQTALFFAALLGRTAITKLLLQYGADPNHRCEDGSTAVHAAVFSSKPWLLHALLDAGGDLRLHDLHGRTPRDWLTTAPQQHRARMMDFLDSLTFQVHQRLQSPVMKEHFHTSNCISRFFKHRGWDLNRFLGSKSNQVPCRGFGKMCTDKVLSMSAPIPVIVDSDLTLDDGEAPFSFSCGSFISMTKCMWKGSRVTMKELISRATSAPYLDLLLTEQDYCCQLPHSHLLQLVAVNLSDDLHRTRLVFERVHVGSLYNLLHNKQAEFPRPQAEDLLWTAVQVCEGLMFLHSGGLVMRALSSHSVVLTRPGLAKLTGLGFMVPSKETCGRASVSLALPPSLYNWAAPEVIQQEPCTWKADLYSLCALIQEIYTDMVPWGLAEPTYIKQMVDSGRALAPHWKVPQPHYDLIRMGLRARAQDRRRSLQDLYDTMCSHDKKLPQEPRQNCDLRAESRDVVASSCPPSPQHCATGTALQTEFSSQVETESESETESGETAEWALGGISRIRSNLKASRQLLPEVNRSLDAVENTLRRLDTAGGSRRDVFVFPAVGPPPQYLLQPQGHPVVEKMEVQLRTGEFSLLDPEALSLWTSWYPAEQNPFQESSSPPLEHLGRIADSSSSAFTSEGGGSGIQELTCDRPPLGDKRTVPLSAPGRHSSGPERRQRPPLPDQQPKAQSRCCVSSDTEEEGHSLQPGPEPTTWTNYLSELVAKVTGYKVPGSSDSEEVDHNTQAVCRSNQTRLCLVGCRDNSRKPSTDLCTQKKTTEDESDTDSENSSVGESELEADFHTVNETFSQTCRVWDEEACPQEEGFHRSSLFYSANREETLHAVYSSSTEEKNLHASDSSCTEDQNCHAAGSSCTEDENCHAAGSPSTGHNQHALGSDSPCTEVENQAVAASLQVEWSNMSSVFYSANTEEKDQTAAGGAQSQHSEDNQVCSAEEAADVTVEVCRPATSRTTPPEDALDTNNNQECVAVKNCEDDGGAVSAAQASFPRTENITPPELTELSSITGDCVTELSSITCSPGRLQNRVASPLNRMARCSTPCSPAHHHRAVVRGSESLIPYPDISPDPSSCGHATESGAPDPSSCAQSTSGAIPCSLPAGPGDTCAAVLPAGEEETYTTALQAVEAEQQEKVQSDKEEEEIPHREAHAQQVEDDDVMDRVLCRDEEFGDEVSHSRDKGDCVHPEEKWPALVVGSAEGTNLLEDTNRALSTLDEVLQEEDEHQTSQWQSSLDCLDSGGWN